MCVRVRMCERVVSAEGRRENGTDLWNRIRSKRLTTCFSRLAMSASCASVSQSGASSLTTASALASTTMSCSMPKPLRCHTTRAAERISLGCQGLGAKRRVEPVPGEQGRLEQRSLATTGHAQCELLAHCRHHQQRAVGLDPSQHPSSRLVCSACAAARGAWTCVAGEHQRRSVYAGMGVVSQRWHAHQRQRIPLGVDTVSSGQTQHVSDVKARKVQGWRSRYVVAIVTPRPRSRSLSRTSSWSRSCSWRKTWDMALGTLEG